jgi:HAD superfamily hydrolase (TIGR01509 family)
VKLKLKNLNRPLRAVIFDMDGLLVDSGPAWLQAETALIEARGFPFNLAVRQQIVGLRLVEIVARFREFYHLRDSVKALAAELQARMLALIPQLVTPQPGASALLAYLAAHNIPCALASSSPLAIIDATLHHQGWLHYFSIRCSGADEAKGKPAPDVYLRATERLGVAPADCLALEDSLTGARAAAAAGMVCGVVPDHSHTRPEAFTVVTAHIFESLHAVLAALEVVDSNT